MEKNRDEHFELLGGIKVQVDLSVAKLDKIEKILGGMPCKTHTLRLAFIEAIVYGAVGIILSAYLVAQMLPDPPATPPAKATHAVFQQWAK